MTELMPYGELFDFLDNDKGAMGLVINKPMQITLGNVLRHLKINVTDKTVEKQWWN